MFFKLQSRHSILRDFDRFFLPSFMILVILFAMNSCKTAQKQLASHNQEITEILFRQQKAWNNGNLEDFMSAYLKSDSLTFIGRNGITYGWYNVLENYQNSYPSRQAMGTLDFKVIHLDQLSNDTFRMIGSYQLTYNAPGHTQKGYFSLIWQQIDGKWFIISDHTSG